MVLGPRPPAFRAEPVFAAVRRELRGRAAAPGSGPRVTSRTRRGPGPGVRAALAGPRRGNRCASRPVAHPRIGRGASRARPSNTWRTSFPPTCASRFSVVSRRLTRKRDRPVEEVLTDLMRVGRGTAAARDRRDDERSSHAVEPVAKRHDELLGALGSLRLGPSPTGDAPGRRARRGRPGGRARAGRRLLDAVLLQDREGRFAREGTLSGQQLVEDHPQRVQVAARLRATALDDLGGDVVRGARGRRRWP